MSLRRKIALVLFLAVASLVGLDNYLYRTEFEHRFRKQDQETVKFHLNATIDRLNALTDEAQIAANNIARTVGDQPQQASDTLATLAQSMDLDVLVAFDREGWVQFSNLRLPKGFQGTTIREFPNERLSPNNPLSFGSLKVGANKKEEDSNHRGLGLFSTEAGTMLVGSADTPSGQLRYVVGRFLDAESMDSLSQRSGAIVEIKPARDLMASIEDQELLNTLLSSPGAEFVASEKDSVVAAALLEDILLAPSICMRIQMPKELGHLWADISRFSLLSMISLSLLCPLVLLMLLQWIVTGPLKTLSEHATRIAKDDTVGTRIQLQRSDEIGMLAHEFDAMLDQLERSRQEGVSAARLAGISDLSAGVLHNVGNLLNTVAVTANLSRDAAKELPLNDLRAVSCAIEAHGEELAEYLASDPRGKNLPAYLAQLVDFFEDRANHLSNEALAVGDGIGEVARLIATLQESANSSGVVDSIKLEEQMDSVVELCRMSGETKREIRIQKNYRCPERILMDRHKFNMILVNVVRNAMESVLASDASEPTIVIEVTKVEHSNLVITICDNGKGIAEADLTRVFGMGHTYKSDRQGMGLHFASTAATELGGSLTASSPGPGQGATFRLELPELLAPQSAEKAA